MKRNWVIAVLAIGAIATAGGALMRFGSQDPEGSEVDAATSPAASRSVVRLTSAKRSNVSIRHQPAAVRHVQPRVTVSGKLRYDETRHVSVRAATEGSVRSIAVKPGTPIAKGDLLCVLDSPEIGSARSEVLRRQAEVELAGERVRWQEQIGEGVAALIEDIRARAPVDQVSERFQSATLGEYGGTLVERYSQFALARDIADNARSIGGGAVSGRVVRQRESDRQRAAASLKSAIEQAFFDIQQAEAKAVAELDDVRRSLRLSQQRLATLLGRPLSSPRGIDISPNDPDLSRVERRSPIGGTVEARRLSESERFARGDELFVIADTSRLWVEARIRIGDWKALQVVAGDTLRVHAPAIPDREFVAALEYVGREVDPESRSIPLVASIDNTDAALKPGMYARIEVPAGPADEVLVVPDSAVIELGARSAVFVVAGNTFHARRIELGRTFDRWIEVTGGIQAGEEIVTEGAFVLKSELLLEGEE
jgi:multidrug efflux pump subunit AcrA (membrane-fusion protein)